MNIKNNFVRHNENDVPWRLFTPNSADEDYCILWIQGWSSSMDSHREAVERMAMATNTSFATLDYAGHGLNKITLDNSTRQQQYEELVAVFDEVDLIGFKKIIVIGGSFGGYMTALLTGIRPVHTAILRCPANYPNQDIDIPYKDTLRARSDEYAAYMKTEQADNEIHTSKASIAIANYNGFTYILEHELDEVVPAKVPRYYYSLAKHGNYLIIPKTAHSPKTLNDPSSRFAYIEHTITSIIESVKLQDKIS